MTKAVILIIEDDPDIQELLSHSFENEGWHLLFAKTGEDGLKYLKNKTVNCILLDIMLPGIDGIEVLKKIKDKKDWRDIPIIMTTAKGEETDIVIGLELGADDYVVKPYSPKILIARIRTALRRRNEKKLPASDLLEQGDIKLNSSHHTVFFKNKQLDLLATEFDLLQHFLTNPEIVFSRNQIIEAIKGPDYPVTDRSVDVQILGLRKKLGEAGDMIETIRGVGYRFRIPETKL